MKREGTLGTASRQDTRAQWALRAVLGIGIAALLVVGGQNWTAWAQTDRFVSPFGDDMGGTNDCTSPDTPCKTIQNAVNQSGAGDLIEVAGGTYAENVSVTHSVP